MRVFDGMWVRGYVGSESHGFTYDMEEVEISFSNC